MEDSKLDKELHIKYWQRCLKTFLPTQYTSTDSNRMFLGFFILSALDLLGAGAEKFPEQDRRNFEHWILSCQHPNGGFCGSPNHKYPDEYYADVGFGQQQMDPANLPATFFAILGLTFVGTLDKIKRDACLKWLQTVQRDDGSFGEMITQDGLIKGGRDMRYCYIAVAIRWLLRGTTEVSVAEDINVNGLINHLRSGQTYDGGISESSEHEAHAGYTYCAIAALSFLDRLPQSKDNSRADVQLSGLTNIPQTIKWLVSRQQVYLDDDDEEDSHKSEGDTAVGVPNDDAFFGDLSFVGFNGRCNKSVDTCYAFWVGASLDILGHGNIQLINAQAIRRFLFEQTQHRIGGFGKYPGSPPDIYHSYLGLAALATMREPGLKPLDSPLCISTEHRDKIGQLRKDLLTTTRTYWKNGYYFSIREDDPDFDKKIASSEEPPSYLKDLMQG